MVRQKSTVREYNAVINVVNYKKKSLPLEIVGSKVQKCTLVRLLTDYDINRVKRRIFFRELPVTELRNLIIRRMRLALRENEDENIRLPFQALLGKLHRG